MAGLGSSGSLAGDSPDELLERVRVRLAHVHHVPHVEERGQPRAPLPAFQDDWNDRPIPFGYLAEQCFYL
jgi:hypothetical protein